jgi:hypothetical protein
MSEPEKPKRKFWQLHLGTAVGITVFLGVEIGANCHWGMEFYDCFNKSPFGDRPHLYNIGWPINFYHHDIPDGFSMLYPRQLAIDIGTNVIFLLIITFLIEYLIRRREAGKT